MKNLFRLKFISVLLLIASAAQGQTLGSKNSTVEVLGRAKIDTMLTIHSGTRWTVPVDTAYLRNDSIFGYKYGREFFVAKLLSNSTRFGYSGEDDVAGEQRLFNLGGTSNYGLEISGTGQYAPHLYLQNGGRYDASVQVSDSHGSFYDSYGAGAAISGTGYARLFFNKAGITDTSVELRADSTGIYGYFDFSTVETKNYLFNNDGSYAIPFAKLADVNFTSLADGQLAKYDAGTGKWINYTPSIGSQNLQQVTDIGAVTTHRIDLENAGWLIYNTDSPTYSLTGGLEANNVYEKWQQGTGNLYVRPQNITSTRNIEWPNASGTLAMSVNGIAANTVGNIVLTGFASSTLTNTHLFVGNASNIATDVAASGDLSLANTGAFTFNTVNSNVGSFGDGSHIPTFTVNAKGLITAASSTTVNLTPTWQNTLTNGSTLTQNNTITGNNFYTAWENGRLEAGQGAAVAAANNLTLGSDGNTFSITGATQINAITTANWQAGSTISLVFASNPVVKNNTAGGAGTAKILLSNGADYTAAANDVLTLLYDGTLWHETARKIAGTSPAWLLASGGLLTGVNNITNNAVNGIIWNGAYTTTATGQYYTLFNPSITTRVTAADTMYVQHMYAIINNQNTSGVQNDVLLDLDAGFTQAGGGTSNIYALQHRGHIIPKVSNTYNLGSAARTYNNLYSLFTNSTNILPLSGQFVTIRDFQNNGMARFHGTTAATTNMGTISLQVASVGQLTSSPNNVALDVIGPGSFWGSLIINSLTTPVVSLATVGTAGTITNTYKVVANLPAGTKTDAGAQTITTANTTLTGSNYVAVSWVEVPGARSYDVYLTATDDATSPPALGKLATVTSAFTYSHTGASGDATTPPTSNNTGNLGVGVTTPTAGLHLKAGVAGVSGAPLKFTSGTNLTTTEAGTVEYDGTHLYFTAANAGTRYQLDQQTGSGGTVTSVSGTANRITSTGGTTPVIDIDATFENLLLKKANNLSDLASAATSRTNLGGTTIGQNLFTLTNPSAITFPRINADNTVSALDAATFRTAIGAGTSSTNGTVTTFSGVTSQGVSWSVANPTTTPAATLTLGALTEVTSFNGLVVTANTGVITTGTWNGTALTSTYLPSSVVYNNQANTYTAGMKQTFQADATNAGLRFGGVTANPSSLAAGDAWYRSDENKFHYYDGTTDRKVVAETLTQVITNKDLTSITNTFPALTGDVTKPSGSDVTTIIDAFKFDYTGNIEAALGSAIKAESIPINRMTATNNLQSQTQRMVAIWIPKAQTITGVKWFQTVQGVYTASNYNGVGLFSYDGAGNLTLVASSTDDGTIWSTPASNSWSSKAFSSTYSAAAGLYFITLLYCSSAQTTAPAIGANQGLQNAGIVTGDFTNSGKIAGNKASTTSLANSTMSAFATVATYFYIALY